MVAAWFLASRTRTDCVLYHYSQVHKASDMFWGELDQKDGWLIRQTTKMVYFLSCMLYLDNMDSPLNGQCREAISICCPICSCKNHKSLIPAIGSKPRTFKHVAPDGSSIHSSFMQALSTMLCTKQSNRYPTRYLWRSPSGLLSLM